MTYLQFHLVFIIPVSIGLWLFFAKQPVGNWTVSIAAGMRAVWLTALIALVFTIPWDGHLIAEGAWAYPPDRVLWVVGNIPIEEISFFVLMTMLTGILTLIFLKGAKQGNTAPWVEKWPVLAIYLLVSAGGWWMLAQGGQWFYLGMILGFFMPVLALSWAVGGEHIARYAKPFWLSVACSSAYLWACDWFAIVRQNIWSVSLERSTGINFFGLPLEEMVFFLVVNMVIAQSVMLFSHPRFSKFLSRSSA